MSREVDRYGEMFKRARLEASARLGIPELRERVSAARFLGVTESALKKIESGERRPSFEMLETLARAYNVQIGDLLPSSAPRGPQADRILAPVLLLPPMMRETFIIQMEAFARITLAGITEATELAMSENTGLSPTESVPSSGPIPANTMKLDPAGVPAAGVGSVVEFDRDGEEDVDVVQQRKIPARTKTPTR